MNAEKSSPFIGFLVFGAASLILVCSPKSASAEGDVHKPKAGLMLSLQAHGQVVGFGENLDFADRSNEDYNASKFPNPGASVGYRFGFGLEPMIFTTRGLLAPGVGLRFWAPIASKIHPYAEVSTFTMAFFEGGDFLSVGLGADYELSDSWAVRAFAKYEDGNTRDYRDQKYIVAGFGISYRL